MPPLCHRFATVKDMIIRGGENVSANAVEDAAYAASLGIKECAAVAAPDKRYGETVALVCVPVDPANAPSAEMVKEKLRARLPVVSVRRRGTIEIGNADQSHVRDTSAL